MMTTDSIARMIIPSIAEFWSSDFPVQMKKKNKLIKLLQENNILTKDNMAGHGSYPFNRNILIYE